VKSRATPARRAPHELIGIATAAIAVALLSFAWYGQASHQVTADDARLVLLALGLAAGIVMSFHFPIHVDANAKLYVGSVVLYLTSVLLPPALAATAIGVATIVGEASIRRRTGNPWSDTAGQAGRWAILGWTASVVAHLPGSLFPFAEAPVIIAGVVLWAGDLLTGAVHAYSMAPRPLHRIVLFMVRTGGAAEAAQYLVGLLGVLEATERSWTLVLLALPIVFIYRSLKQSKEIHDETLQILESMADAVDLRDPYTGGHSRRVADLAGEILRQMGKRGVEVKLIRACARVHDIGKIGLPDAILRKADMLTADEWTVMRRHAEQGAELVGRYPDFRRGADIIRHHHEAWDGTGYPAGLRGTAIPFGARVITVADSFDAMTSDRPYRRGMRPSQAAAILRDGRGRQWDAQIVDALLAAIAEPLEVPAVAVLPAPSRSDAGEQIAAGTA
jgi:putative nucleotidyltransferase with HDIG domain